MTEISYDTDEARNETTAQGDTTDEILSIPIDCLPFSIRTANALINNGVETLRDLCEYSLVEIAKFRGAGGKALREIEAFINQLSNYSVVDYMPLHSYLSLEKVQAYIEENRKHNWGSSGKTNLLQSIDGLQDDARDNILSTPIEALQLSARTTNALANNDIKTLRDFRGMTPLDLKDLKGFGAKAYSELKEALDNIPSVMHNEVHQIPLQSLHSFIQENLSEREIDFVARFYGLNSDRQTTREIAEAFSVSGSRAAQIIQKATRKIGKGIKHQRVVPEIYQQLKGYVGQGGVRLDQITELDSFYTNAGVVQLYANIFPEEFAVFKDYHLQHQWLVAASEIPKYWRPSSEWLPLADRIQAFCNQVRYAEEPELSLDQLTQKCNISKDMARDMPKLNLEGDVVLRDSRTARRQRILAYMRQQKRPVSVQEASEALGIPIELTRNAMCDLDNVVNIGRSIYALREDGYSDKSTVELIQELLEDVSEPLPLSQIYDYVKRYRQIGQGAIQNAIILNPSIFTVTQDGLVTLEEWGYTPAEGRHKVYEVPAEVAALDIINSSNEPLTTADIRKRIAEKYGDRASSVNATVSAALVALADAHQIRRLKLSQSTVYLKNS